MICYVIKNDKDKYLAISNQDFSRYWTTIERAYYFRDIDGSLGKEKFPFMPYKEFINPIKPTNIIFKSKDNVEMKLAIWFNSESETDSRTVKLTNRNDWNICYFEKPLTQENYHKALRVYRKLFLGD